MASGVSEGGIAKIKLVKKQKETPWGCSYKFLTWKSESRNEILSKKVLRVWKGLVIFVCPKGPVAKIFTSLMRIWWWTNSANVLNRKIRGGSIQSGTSQWIFGRCKDGGAGLFVLLYRSGCCLGTKRPAVVVRESFFILPDAGFPSRFLFKKNKQRRKKAKQQKWELDINMTLNSIF